MCIGPGGRVLIEPLGVFGSGAVGESAIAGEEAVAPLALASRGSVIALADGARAGLGESLGGSGGHCGRRLFLRFIANLVMCARRAASARRRRSATGRTPSGSTWSSNFDKNAARPAAVVSNVECAACCENAPSRSRSERKPGSSAFPFLARANRVPHDRLHNGIDIGAPDAQELTPWCGKSPERPRVNPGAHAFRGNPTEGSDLRDGQKVIFEHVFECPPPNSSRPHH